MINKIKSNPLLKKFLAFSVGGWIALLIGLISTPITTRIFSPEELGKASMFNLAINVSMMLLLFGTDQAYVRFFYEEKHKYMSCSVKKDLFDKINTKDRFRVEMTKRTETTLNVEIIEE